MRIAPMRPEDKFSFNSKYKDLTMLKVFQGTRDIDRELLRLYIEEKISTEKPAFNTHADLLQIMAIEVSTTQIRTICDFEEYATGGDWTNSLEGLFRDGNTQADLVTGSLSLDYCNTKLFANKIGKPIVAGGQPSYIEWCIRKDKFYLDEDTIAYFELIDYYFFEGITIIRKADDIYEYEPKIKTLKWKFSDDVLKKNAEKQAVNADLDGDDEDDNGNWKHYERNERYSSNNVDEDYFDAMTDGQLGDYDDYVGRGGNIDDIGDWAGR